MRLNKRLLPLLLLTKTLLLHWEIPNMVPFLLALEANDLGRILDLYLALLLVTLGLIIVIGVKSKSTLFIGGLLHTQHVVKCSLPFMTLFQAFLHRSGLGLELSSLYG